jgi:hypothetical protein
VWVEEWILLMTARLERKGAGWVWIALWLVAWTGQARAEATWLVWERDPGAERCPSASQIAHAVNARLGAEWLALEPAGGERAFGRVSRVEDGFELLLTLRDANRRLVGTRRLHDTSGDCSTLAAASVLALTLMAGALPQVAGPLASARPIAWAVEAGAAGSLGFLAAPRAHAYARVDMRVMRRLVLEIQLLGLGRARRRVPSSKAAVVTTPLAGLLHACVVILERPHLRWDGCLGLMAGVLHARGEHFGERSLVRWSALLAPVARLPLRIPLTRWLQAGVALNLGVPVLRPEHRYRDADGVERRVHPIQPVFGWLELGLGATF